MHTFRVNLVPLERRQARRCRVQLHRWLVACGLYALVVAGAWVFVQFGPAGNDQTLRDEHGQAQLQVTDAQAELAILSDALTRSQVELEARNAVGRQPNWSWLLALLSRTLGERIVLRDLGLASHEAATAGGAAAGQPGAEPSGISLTFNGLGQSQADVSRFILRLEEIPLFRSVKLIDTRREPFLSGHAVAFGVECVLDDRPGVRP